MTTLEAPPRSRLQGTPPRWLAGGALLALLAHCADAPALSAPPIAGIESAIVGGEPAADCAWPSTVRISESRTCTGTLIHPRIVTTAAHCLQGDEATIGFGPRGGPTSFSVRARCEKGASGETGVSTGRDWAYCVLPEDERIAQVPATPPLVGCEADRFLKVGARGFIVGYGTTGAAGGGGEKRQVEVEIHAINLTAGTIAVGDEDAGACYGDSGGPIYMRLVDAAGRDFGSRVFGATSGPREGADADCLCNCGTTFVNIAQHVAAIEAHEGIDVTPCTDARGRWAPGPDCDALPTDPEHGHGTWPACTLETTELPIESCGPSKASEPRTANLDVEPEEELPPADSEPPEDEVEAPPPDEVLPEEPPDDKPYAGGSSGAYGRVAGCSAHAEGETLTPLWLALGVLGLLGRRRRARA